MKIQSTYLYAEVLSFWSWEKWGPLKKNVGKWMFATLLCGLKLRHPLSLCHYFMLLVEPLTLPKKKKFNHFYLTEYSQVFHIIHKFERNYWRGLHAPLTKWGMKSRLPGHWPFILLLNLCHLLRKIYTLIHSVEET